MTLLLLLASAQEVSGVQVWNYDGQDDHTYTGVADWAYDGDDLEED